MSKMRRQAVPRAGVDSTDFQLAPHFTGGESEASRGSGSCPKTGHQVLGQIPTREPASTSWPPGTDALEPGPTPRASPPDPLLLSCHHPPLLTSPGVGGGRRGQGWPWVITGHYPGITRILSHKDVHSLLKFPGDFPRRRAVRRERCLLLIAGSPLRSPPAGKEGW